MCGVFGVTNRTDASKYTYLGLFALQHRGQESAGIMATDASGNGDTPFRIHRGRGLVSDVFEESTLARLGGVSAIGHVRYSTAGGMEDANIQPLSARIAGQPVAISHNGNIVNAARLRKELEREGAILNGTADTEIILHLLARAPQTEFVDKLKFALSRLVGAYSLLILTPTHLYAMVDPLGYRPLVLGELPQEGNNSKPAWALSSETCAFDLVGARTVREIEPGELISIHLKTGELKSEVFAKAPRKARCSFEHIYFARPDSLLWDESAHEVRFALGEELAKTSPAKADMIMAVPDSGIPMAMGFAHASGIPYRNGLIRNHYVGRTFIEPGQNVRNFRVRLKLNPIKEIIRGKRIVVIDDSIVRGTTSKKIMELLRDAGAAEIHLRIASPPVAYSCFYGIDTPERADLLAQKMTVQEMRDFLRADSLAFLQEQSLTNVLQKTKQGWCTSCFTGKYQDEISQEIGNP